MVFTTGHVSQENGSNALYLKKDKSGSIVEKKSKKIERMHHSISFKKAAAKLIPLKWKYLIHKYRVCNDSYH